VECVTNLRWWEVVFRIKHGTVRCQWWNDVSYCAKAPLDGDIRTKCEGDLQQSIAGRLPNSN